MMSDFELDDNIMTPEEFLDECNNRFQLEPIVNVMDAALKGIRITACNIDAEDDIFGEEPKLPYPLKGDPLRQLLDVLIKHNPTQFFANDGPKNGFVSVKTFAKGNVSLRCITAFQIVESRYVYRWDVCFK